MDRCAPTRDDGDDRVADLMPADPRVRCIPLDEKLVLGEILPRVFAGVRIVLVSRNDVRMHVSLVECVVDRLRCAHDVAKVLTLLTCSPPELTG